MSDNVSDEEPPALVSTDEEDEEEMKTTKNSSGPVLPPILKSDADVADDLRKYIRKEDRMKQVSDALRILILDPFLFGTDNSAKKHNKAWIEAAWKKFDLPKSRSNLMHGELGDENMFAVSLLELACTEVNEFLSDRRLDTFKMLKIIDHIHKEYKDDKLENVDRYSEERVVDDISGHVVKTYPTVPTQLHVAAKFAVLYVLNTWTFYAHQKFCCDFDVTTEVEVEKKAENGENRRVSGNEDFKAGKFESAIRHYGWAIETNPHHYVYYGNRAQAYLRLKSYRKAASDGMRAVALNPDWVKGLYRYAEALYELQHYDEAYDINERAHAVLKRSKDCSKDRDKVYKQKERILYMMKENKENKGDTKGNKLEKNSKAKKSSENGKRGQNKESESDEDVPDLASAESESDDDHISVLDPESAMKLSDELKNNKRPGHDFKSHSVKKPEVVQVEFKKDKEAKWKGGIKEETLKKEQEKARELAAANRKVEAEKRKGPLRPGTNKHPIKLQKSSRVDGTEALQNVRKKDCEKLKSMMAMGSEALRSKRSRNAIDHFIEAQDFIMSKNFDYFNLDIVDVMLLKYAHGVALVDTGTFERILEGITTHKVILEDYPKQSFPLAYYGIGQGYIKQNRYQDAIEPLNHGFTIVKKNAKFGVQTWPGTSLVIEETMNMKRSFQDLLSLCRHPPSPDAVCFYIDCHGFFKKEIYFSDPDFQGFVRTICFANCKVDFHMACWKKFRTVTEDRHSEKDYLERPCFTPDCYGCIIKVLIYDKDGLAKKEFTSEVDHREKGDKKPAKKVRQELSNPVKIKQREEKKALRKQRKLEAKERKEHEDEQVDILEELERRMDERQTDEAMSVTTEDVDSRSHTSHTTGGGVVEDDPLPNEKDMMVLRKEEDEGGKFKVVMSKKSKKKKKEKAAKVTLSLDEFVGRERAEEEDEEIDPDNPFSVPRQLRSEIDMFQNCKFVTGSGDSSVVLTPAEEEIAENLYVFFEDHLQGTGPLYIHDPSLAALLEDFPPEANDIIRKYQSLSNFLLQNLKFAMMEEHLCLLKDSVRAKRIADERLGKWTTKYQSYSQSVGAASPPIQPQVTLSASGTRLDPSAREFHPSAFNLNVNGGEITRHGDLSEFDLPNVPPLSEGDLDFPMGLSEEFPVLGDEIRDMNSGGGSESAVPPSEKFTVLVDEVCDVNPRVQSESASRTSLSGSLSSSCDDLKGNLSDSRSSNDLPGQKATPMEVPSFLLGPPGAVKKKLPQKPRSSSSENMPPFLSGPPLARNVSSPSPKMGSPKAGSPLRASPKPPEVRERKRSVAEEFKRQVFEKLQPVKNDSGSDRGETPPGENKDDLGQMYKSDSENSLEDLDTVDDVVVTATDTQKLDGEDYDGNLDTDVNKTFQKAVGNERSGPKTLYDFVPHKLHGASPYGGQNDLNAIGKSGNVPENLMEKMKLAREAWNAPVSDNDQTSKFGLFPSVHSGPGFGGLPLKMSPSSFSRQSDLNTSMYGVEGFSDFDREGKDSGDTSKHSDSFTSDLNASMEQEIEKLDDDFVNEFSASVVETLKQHDAFAYNDELEDIIRSTVQNDLQRSGRYKALHPTQVGGTKSSWGSNKKDTSPKSAANSRSVAIQCEDRHVSVTRAVQTDPYEPYKLERDALQRQLTECSQMLAHVKGMCLSQRERYQELMDKYEASKKQTDLINAEHEHVRGCLQRECVNAQEEVKRVNEQLQQSQTQEQSYLSRINELQQNMNEVTQRQQEEGERLTGERNRHINIIRQLESNIQQQMAAARNTEVELLEFKLDIGMQLMDKHLKDAEHYYTNLQAVVKKFEEMKVQVPPKLLKSIEQWQTTKDLIRQTAENCQKSFHEQIRLVKEGTVLATLPKLDLPRAPPPPEPLPPHLLRPPMPFRQGQNPGGPVPGMYPPGQVPQRMSPTDHSNSPSPTGFPASQPWPQGPVPQTLPQFRQVPPQAMGMPHGKRPSPPPGVAQVDPGMQPPAAKPASDDPRPKSNPGFPGPPSGPPGLGLPNQPPIGGPPGAAMGAAKKTAAPKNSFEKIMQNLTKLFPNYKRQQLMGFVQRLRTGRRGSLTGMTLDDITCEVANMILESDPGAVQMAQGGTAGLSGLHDSGSSTPSSGLSGNQTPLSNFDDEDFCVICHEDMAPGSSISLECQHIFHDHCIRQWLRENRSCPTCRKYALLSDEFPSLG